MNEEIKLPEGVGLKSAVGGLSVALQDAGCRVNQPEFLAAVHGDKSDLESFQALCALARERRLDIPAILAKESDKKNPAISGEQVPD